MAIQPPDTVVDTHVHVWSRDRDRYPAVPGNEEIVERDGSAETLVALMDDAGVSLAVLVQTPWFGDDDPYLLDATRLFPGRFAAVAYFDDPFRADTPERLTRRHEQGVRGVRLHLPGPGIADGVVAGRADALFRRARDLGVPVLFLNRLPFHGAIAYAADQFPDMTVVIDHLGHPNVDEAPTYPSSATLFSLAERPNVYAKLSNQLLSSRRAFPWSDLHDYQRRMIDRFGPQRLMWGSNWPMQTDVAGYGERLEAVSRHLPGLSADERGWILGRTALRLWAPIGPA